MNTTTQFVIENTSQRPLVIFVEPEAHEVPLKNGEEVRVTDNFVKTPVTVRFCEDENGEPMLILWPGDGNMIVTRNGKDVLDVRGSASALQPQ